MPDQQKTPGNGHAVEVPRPQGIFAGDLLNRGIEYVGAFEKLMQPPYPRELVHPAYFLLIHSLELCLKAFLAARGVSENELWQLGHNVRSLLKRAVATGLDASDDLTALVSRTGSMNSRDDFRYPSGYVLRVPSPDVSLPVVRSLIAQISDEVFGEAIEAMLEIHGDHTLRGKRIAWSDTVHARKPSAQS